MIPRRGLLALAALVATRGSAAASSAASAAPALMFPRDFGAHPQTKIEWWYATGWLQDSAALDNLPAFGFQLTFFRSRTGLADKLNSRFAARQLLFAHAALTELAAQRLVHAERIARWNGNERVPRAAASLVDTRIHIGDWRLERSGVEAGSIYNAALGDDGAGFAYRLVLATTQPLLLQGAAGLSQKGPDAAQASRYYSQPQLAVSGELRHGGKARSVRGGAWLDHEWSDSLLPEGAVGWDWIGINLADGSALTAFALRRADGSVVWAGGSQRARGGEVRAFGAGELRFEPLAHWTSAATRARYPVRWRVHTPVGMFELRALLDAQELDNRASTGTVYWEGLAELLDAGTRRRLGLGYLEMTGYAAPLRL